MRILYCDCFCGFSGEKYLGAAVDLGLDPALLRRELSRLGLDSAFRLDFLKETKNGMTGIRAEIVPTGENSGTACCRHLADVRKIVGDSSLKDSVKKKSMDIFTKIAQAEAVAQGTAAEEACLSEAGTVAALVEAVGAAVATELLGADEMIASTVGIKGVPEAAEAGFPPALPPVTGEVLRGVPLRFGAAPFETVTPVGAAILSACVSRFTDRPEFTAEKIGYGIGHQDGRVPDVLRIYLARTPEAAVLRPDAGLLVARDQYIVETNIDDMNPEFYSHTEERLFQAGALDVYKTPILMKKSRPSVKLSVLTDASAEQAVLEVLFRETTSLGVRKYAVEKIMLPRTTDRAATRWGDVSVKLAYYKGEFIKYKAEYEDCRRLAVENGVPLAEIYKEVESAMAMKRQAPGHANEKAEERAD